MKLRCNCNANLFATSLERKLLTALFSSDEFLFIFSCSKRDKEPNGQRLVTILTNNSNFNAVKKKLASSAGGYKSLGNELMRRRMDDSLR
jgi:hypothetical protein